MKHFAFAFLVVLLSASCKSSPDTNTKTAATDSSSITAGMVTLNGYTFNEAETMVRSFISNPRSSHAKTSVWFSRDYIENLEKVLEDEGADGFRIYYGKHAGNNTIVLVGTKKSNNTHPGTNKPTHRDFFTYTNSTYIQAGVKEIMGEIEYNTDGGLRSIDPTSCPPQSCISPNAIDCEDGIKWVQNAAAEKITTTSLWYPRELVIHWRKELDAATTETDTPDGIRFYFAKTDKNQHVFVIATTKNNKRDYIECNVPFVNLDNKAKDSLDDRGEACPNNCNDVTWQ